MKLEMSGIAMLASQYSSIQYSISAASRKLNQLLFILENINNNSHSYIQILIQEVIRTQVAEMEVEAVMARAVLRRKPSA